MLHQSIFTLIFITITILIGVVFYRKYPLLIELNEYFTQSITKHQVYKDFTVQVSDYSVKPLQICHQKSIDTFYHTLTYFQKFMPIDIVSYYENDDILDNLADQMDMAIISEDVLFNSNYGLNGYNQNSDLRFVCGMYFQHFTLISHLESDIYTWSNLENKNLYDVFSR